MIVKNEAKILARCLNCVRSFADEIIIIDTGSHDKTRQIALDFTDKVYDFVWCDDFSKARNFSFSFASVVRNSHSIKYFYILLISPT